jgi:ArsR family transcriptional regulator, zinc-responsive transcriptional repressor
MRMSAYTGRLPDEQDVDLAVEVFRMLADATRVRLLWLMRDGEVSVRGLTEGVGKPQALVSQHLGKLRMSRLVSTRRHGSRVYYRLANDHVGQLLADAIHNAEHAGPGVPLHHQENDAVKQRRAAR